MRLAGQLFREHEGLFLQSHLAENREELKWIEELYPDHRSYVDVYAGFGQLGPRSVLAHGIWIDDQDRAELAKLGASIAFCPTSNQFLGSGLFDYDKAAEAGIRVGLGSDVGAGTSFSTLRTLSSAYQVLQLRGQSLPAAQAFYLATLGGARSLWLDDKIGNFALGKEADFVVIDWASTPLMARRMARAETLEEKLFVLMILGDDRAIAAAHILGVRALLRREGPRERRAAPRPKSSDEEKVSVMGVRHMHALRRRRQHAMGVTGCVGVEPHDIALVIEPVQDRRAGGVRVVQRGESAGPAVIDEAVRDSVDDVEADGDAAIIQPQKLGLRCAGRVDRGESTMLVEETVNGSPGIGVKAGKVAFVVDRRRDRANPGRIVDVGREPAGPDVIGVAVAVAGGIAVKSHGDIAVIDAHKLILDQHSGLRAGIAEETGRFRVVDLGIDAVLQIEAELIVDRHAIVGVVEIADRDAPVVQSGHLGLQGGILGRCRKVLRDEIPGLGQKISLIGMAGVSAAIKAGDQTAIIDPHQIVESGVGGIVESLESVIRML
jgi:hypothetical protein